VAALATAAIQALLEEPNLGLQVVEALLLLLQSCVGVSLELGELFLELGLAPFGSLEHRLVEAGLGAGFGESAVTVGAGTRDPRGRGVKAVHPSEYARSAGLTGGW
jgi:hypothetical protein